MSSYSVLIGSTGVAILLVAFILVLFGFLKPETKAYTLMNVVGSGLAGYASVLIDYMPFVILEAVWALIALVGFVKVVWQRRAGTQSSR